MADRNVTTGRFVASLTPEERKLARRRAVARYNKKRRDGQASTLTQREWNLFYKYGLTEKDFQDILAAQDGRCPICHRRFEEITYRNGATKSVWHVDHDHATGKVRGVLCFLCNSGLGKFGDNVDRLLDAAAYLEQHQE